MPLPSPASFPSYFHQIIRGIIPPAAISWQRPQRSISEIHSFCSFSLPEAELKSPVRAMYWSASTVSIVEGLGRWSYRGAYFPLMCFHAHISQHNVWNHLPYLRARRRDKDREICGRDYLGDAAKQGRDLLLINLWITPTGLSTN
jgi:hypothetical protein